MVHKPYVHNIWYPAFLSQEKQVNLMLTNFKRLKASLGDGGSPISLHLQGFWEFVVHREKHRDIERESDISPVNDVLGSSPVKGDLL